MLANVETLIELQFQKIGKWALTNESLSIEFDTGKSALLQTPNVLYSFVIYSNDDSSTIGYIGKTSKSIKNRFQGYLKSPFIARR
jgi:hypothetical protein